MILWDALFHFIIVTETTQLHAQDSPALNTSAMLMHPFFISRSSSAYSTLILLASLATTLGTTTLRIPFLKLALTAS